MKTFKKWLIEKSEEFSERIFLLDEKHSVTYSENIEQIKILADRLSHIKRDDRIVFIGDGCIESYQLYFSIIAIQAVWVPVSYRLDTDIINSVVEKINPSLIIYDQRLLNDEILNKKIKRIELMDLFFANHLISENKFELIEENSNDRIIGAYLTSGSTNIPKIVQHGWHATFQHADATVRRYGLNQDSRLFNPRHIFHVSGQFALTTLLHAGGSIVIPRVDSYSKPHEECQMDWANLMLEMDVTHASFFPSEMKSYAVLIENHPELKPEKLIRITTGGENTELPDLIQVSRAFARNKMLYDCLWSLYPFLGDGKLFACSKLVYEYLCGAMVQVTLAYGATELICNAYANTFVSGPDTRGIGTALHSLHPQIIDDNGIILPHDGKMIGRLRLYGSSIAINYLDFNDPSLSPNCYQTNDLASIYPNGQMTLFGRYENLIKLPGVNEKINPLLLERGLLKISGVKGVMVFENNNKLHAAFTVSDDAYQAAIIRKINENPEYALVSTISLWDSFPLSLGGKVDRKKVIDTVKQGDIVAIDIELNKEEVQKNEMKFCSMF